MRVADKGVVQELLLLLRKHGNVDQMDSGEISYSLGDMVAVFRKDGRHSVFSGMMFKIFSKDFFILDTLEITTVADVGDDVSVVEDPAVIDLIDEHLRWRSHAIRLLL